MADTNTFDNPFLLSLFPSQENLIPYTAFQTIDSGWIEGIDGTANNSYFRAQWVQCSYQISGGYGPTPRYLFYALAIVAIFVRKTSWAVSIALASVMVYGSSAAIHALVLASIHQRMVPRYFDRELRSRAGTSQTGLVESPPGESNAPVWLPVLPMSWDDDCDPVVAIVDSAFLLLLPIQIWSRTFAQAKPEQKAIVFTWALLLLVGLICALVNDAYIDVWSFPQLRFCPIDQEDTLPILNSGIESVAGTRDRQDLYHWNRTVRDFFIYKNLSVHPPNTCLYPCFDFQWPLRDPADIFVVGGTYGVGAATNTSYWLLVVVYVLVMWSGASSLTILVIRLAPSTPHVPAEWRDLRVMTVLRKTNQAWNEVVAHPTAIRLYRILFLRIWVLIIIAYALILSRIAFAFMVSYTEWIMWDSDPGGETFRHIGQWGALVATIFVFGAVVMPSILSFLKSKPLCDSGYSKPSFSFQSLY